MNKKTLYSMALGITVSMMSVFAAEETAEASTYDKIWGVAKFIDNDDAAILQMLQALG